MFSEFMAVNTACLNPLIFPSPSMFHMPSTIIRNSSQTGEATSKTLMGRKGMNREENVEMAIQGAYLRQCLWRQIWAWIHVYVMFSFSVSSKYFQISLLISCLINSLFRHILFSFKYLGTFLQILLLIFNLIPLWSKNIYCMILNILDLLRFVLWLRIWSILVNVLCILEESMHSAFVQCSVNDI